MKPPGYIGVSTRATLPIRGVRGIATAAVSVAVLLQVYACGSSSTTVLGPSSERCEIALPGSSSTVPADGGSGSVAVSASRECLWSATSESSWLTITSGASGQGDGTVSYQASSNPAPTQRRGALVINNRRAEVAQAAAPCQFRLGSTGQPFESGGGEGAATVQTLEGCDWTAATGTSWIAITALQNTGGPGTVRFRVEPNTGDARTGTLTIAGLTFSIVQAGAGTQCSYSLEPAARSVPASGGPATVTISAPNGCGWTAVSQAPWITVTNGASGSGNGLVTVTIPPNTGTERTGTVVIASQLHTITQAGGTVPCSYSIAPTSQSVPVAGGTGTVNVTAPAGCAWTALSQAAWITVTAGATGSGNGTVTLTIAANTGFARAGTVTIAGQTYLVSQAAAPTPCTYGVTPTTIPVPPTAGTSTVAVTTQSGCSWTAVTEVPWIAVAEGASGSGNGTVTLTMAANGGSARAGTVTIAGHTVTVNQAAAPAPCSYTIAPTEAAIAAGGGTATVTVTTQSGCAWTAVSQVPWITVVSGGAATGSGGVELTIAANAGGARSGTVVIAGNTFTVTQAAAPIACTYLLMPTSQAVPAAGGDFTVQIATQPGCAWTAVPDVPWIEILGSASGSGAATVGYRVLPSPGGGARAGKLGIGGQHLTVVQGPM